MVVKFPASVTSDPVGCLTRVARHAEASAVANELHGVLVDPQQADRVDVGQDAAVESAGPDLGGHNQLYSHFTLGVKQQPLTSDLSVHVSNATVALCRSVKLADLCDLETLRESLPHTGAQTVAHRQPDLVALF